MEQIFKSENYNIDVWYIILSNGQKVGLSCKTWMALRKITLDNGMMTYFLAQQKVWATPVHILGMMTIT